ncbi:MAG TPA: hypothetical protein VD884_03465 [Ohtaekwangia sp.]|nr:hypothetical protein [Ohtaekwangia sp.]
MRPFKAAMFCFMLMIGCDDNDNQNNRTKFEGVLFTDQSGSPLGYMGDRDRSDWQHDGVIKMEVLELLDFDSHVDITKTSLSEVKVRAFPNPCAYVAMVYFSLTEDAFVKLIVVNEDMEVLFKKSFIGTEEVMIDVADRNKFPSNEIVRVYYSVSSHDNPNFYVGHGDIWICENDCDF